MIVSPAEATASRHAALCLRAAVLVQSLGYLCEALVSGSALGTLLLLDAGWPDRLARLADQTLALAVAGAAVFALVRPRSALLVGLAGIFFLDAVLVWRHGAGFHPELTVGADAVRFAAPLCAWWLARGALPRAALALRFAAAATFALHGCEALLHHPRFVDYLIAAHERLLGARLGQADAESALSLIGAIDLALAAAVLSLRRPLGPLAYMALWGAVTAASRVVHGGIDQLPDAWIRAANAAAPLALFMLVRGGGAWVERRLPSLSGMWRPARWAGALAAAAALGWTMFVHSPRLDAQTGAPTQLRIEWFEDPAHAATISWSTGGPGREHAVYYDTEPREGDLASYRFVGDGVASGRYAAGTAHYHHAPLSELEASTTYYFVVVSDGVVSAERHFVTAPDDDRDFRLVYGGDARSASLDRRRMNRRIAALVESDPGILALWHGGDYVEFGDEWSLWNQWLQDADIAVTSDGRILPIIPTRGNHEADGVVFNQVFAFPGGLASNYFATVIGEKTLLVTLDSNASIGGYQRDWLDATLGEAYRYRFVLAGYHHPAFPAVKAPSGALTFWVPLFDRYAVDLGCESDGHALKRTLPVRNLRRDAKGTVYIGEGGLGVPLRSPSSSRWYLQPPGMAMAAHHVHVLSFSVDSLGVRAVRMDGSIADAFELAPRLHRLAPGDRSVVRARATRQPDDAKFDGCTAARGVAVGRGAWSSSVWLLLSSWVVLHATRRRLRLRRARRAATGHCLQGGRR